MLIIDHTMDPGLERRSVWGQTPVTFRGKFPQADVSELYRQVDVLLAPSVWPESYGLVVREAMLCGCRVIASDRGAVGLDVASENGWIINVESPDSLIRVLREIDTNPEKFRAPPPSPRQLRTARMQAEELVEVYRTEAARLVRTASHGR